MRRMHAQGAKTLCLAEVLAAIKTEGVLDSERKKDGQIVGRLGCVGL